MRPTRLHTRLPVAAVLGAALAATALVGIARAGGDDEAIDQKIIHKILTGIGLQDPNAPVPTYEERSPLVIPNGDALPPPRKAGAAVAKNPAWPKDPDIERAKKIAKQRASEIRDPMEQFNQAKKPLLPSELGPKYSDRRHAGRSYDASSSSPDAEHRMSPSQLGYVGGLFGKMFGSGDEQAAQFTGEPARTSLTEPPPGYLTPSPSQPYGVGGGTASAPKADDYYLTHGTDTTHR
ncbi:MAG: hypothetical protein P8Z80_18280 [Pseudolabrys sp.]|jgi:hypothetical protein